MSAGQGNVLYDSLFITYDNPNEDRGTLHSVGLTTGWGADGLWKLDAKDGEFTFMIIQIRPLDS